MKNILLATTGLFGAALLATAASAAGPKVTVGGFTDFQAGYVSDDFDADTRSQAFRNDTEISVRVDGKTDSGLGYGAVIDLEADVEEDSNGQGTNAARTFTYLDGSWGKVELGSNKGAAATQRVDASTLASATGGINGAWNHQPNLGAGAFTAAGGFVTGAKLVSEAGDLTSAGNGSITDESTYNSNKITYYSPRFSGFQIGASYTPKLGARGQVINRPDNTGGFGDVIEAGVNFEHQFEGGIKLAASATGEIGDTDSAVAGAEDLEAFGLGVLLGYQGFSAAVSYADLGEAQVGVVDGDADLWSAGLAYDGGIYSVSATYLNSTKEVAAGDNDFDNLVIGADYKLAPGITPYAEVSFYDFDSAAGGYDNEGTAVILGTQVAF